MRERSASKVRLISLGQATTETVDVHYAGLEAVIIQPYTHTRNYQPRDSYLIDFCCCDSASSSPYYTLSTHSGSPFLVDIKKKEPGVHPEQEWGAAVRQNETPFTIRTHWITKQNGWKTNKTVKKPWIVNHKPCVSAWRILVLVIFCSFFSFHHPPQERENPTTWFRCYCCFCYCGTSVCVRHHHALCRG